MRDLKRMVSGLGSGTRSKTKDLRTVPAIAEIEALISGPSGLWAPGFEEKAKAASLLLFGITEADTDQPEPRPDDLPPRAYRDALEVWERWRYAVDRYHADVKAHGVVPYWARFGYDVSDGNGKALRCFRSFDYQMLAGRTRLLPEARITLDRVPTPAVQSEEEWGAALAAAAARFKPSR